MFYFVCLFVVLWGGFWRWRGEFKGVRNLYQMYFTVTHILVLAVYFFLKYCYAIKGLLFLVSIFNRF